MNSVLRNLKTIIIAALLILSVGLFSALISLFLNPSTTIEIKRAPVLTMNQEIVPACNYVIANYNMTNHLVSETSAHEKYWIYSDNLLASIVLYPVCKRMDLATNISGVLANYQYSKFPNVYQTFVYNVSNSDAAKDINLSDSIWTTANNQTGTLSPNDYSDIAFLEAYYYARWTTNTTSAQRLFGIGANMYNGTGLVDRSFNGQYQTYKLALYVITAVKLNQTIPFSAIVTLGRMQNTTSGGFNTGYYNNYSTTGATQNTETTSLAIIALANLTKTNNYSHSDFARQLSSLVYPLTYAAIGAGMATVILQVVIATRQRKRVRV